MLDYEKIYKKSVYRENVDAYLDTWKEAVAKRRLFELVPHIDAEKSLAELRAEWDAYETNSYTLFVRALLASYDGYEALRLFNVIHESFLQKDNKVLRDAIDCLLLHLRRYATLIGVFPPNLMRFLTLLKKDKKTYTPNIIFVAAKHKLHCTDCKGVEDLQFVQCLCSKHFYCESCLKMKNSRCTICSGDFILKS